MWFITAILCFYGAFWVMRLLLNRLDVFLLVAAVASTAGVLLLFETNQSGLTGRWGFRMIDFFIGMVSDRDCDRAGWTCH
jgi:peptidoglycan/LPS O-acetylase OafA/YrhL